MSPARCAWIERDEVFEGYVRGVLGPEDRDAFESHYFECAACADRLNTYSALRAELAALPVEVPALQPARGRKRWWALAPVAATCVLAVAVFLWFRNPPRPASPAVVAGAPPATAPVMPPSTGSAVLSSAATSSSVQAPAARAEDPQPSASAVVAMSTLVHVDPPLYVPVALRGPRDEGAEQFAAAMRLYSAGDYAGALAGLRAADELKPGAARTRFFLAVCLLLGGRNTEAAAAFEQAIALGESAYVEESHFYLAKTLLRLGRFAEARRELQRTIARQGGLEEEARQLIAQIDALAARKDRPPDN